MNKYTFTLAMYALLLAFVCVVLFIPRPCHADTPDTLRVFLGATVEYEWSGTFDVAEAHGDTGFLQFSATANTGDVIHRTGFEPRPEDVGWQVFVIGSQNLRIEANCMSHTSVSDHIEIELDCEPQ